MYSRKNTRGKPSHRSQVYSNNSKRVYGPHLLPPLQPRANPWSSFREVQLVSADHNPGASGQVYLFTDAQSTVLYQSQIHGMGLERQIPERSFRSRGQLGAQSPHPLRQSRQLANKPKQIFAEHYCLQMCEWSLGYVATMNWPRARK